MEPDFDVDDLGKSLARFQSEVSFHLTDEPSLPPDIAARLWEAHNAVFSVLQDLQGHYGFAWMGLTVVPRGEQERD